MQAKLLSEFPNQSFTTTSRLAFQLSENVKRLKKVKGENTSYKIGWTGSFRKWYKTIPFLQEWMGIGYFLKQGWVWFSDIKKPSCECSKAGDWQIVSFCLTPGQSGSPPMGTGGAFTVL